MAGLVPAISMGKAAPCQTKRDGWDIRAFTPIFAGYARQSQECVHIRNIPNRVFPIGALRLAEMASASRRRVSSGSMMPSSHSRALA